MNNFYIYIPEEGDWELGKHKTKLEAKKYYLKWAKRKTLPRGSHIWEDKETIGSYDAYSSKKVKNNPPLGTINIGDIVYTTDGDFMILDKGKVEGKLLYKLGNVRNKSRVLAEDTILRNMTYHIAKDEMDNPPQEPVEIYDRILEIRAKKGKNSLWPGQLFKHPFKAKSKARILGNPDGSLTIRSSNGTSLWKHFDY